MTEQVKCLLVLTFTSGPLPNMYSPGPPKGSIDSSLSQTSDTDAILVGVV